MSSLGLLSPFNSQEVTLETTELEIRLRARAFREAIIKAGQGVLLTLDNFPAGSCGDASILLATYLEELGYGRFDYVCGSRNGHSHAWLAKDGLIVDITADQFPEIKEMVFVGNEHHWHGEFCEDPERYKVRINDYDSHTRTSLTQTYHNIRNLVKVD